MKIGTYSILSIIVLGILFTSCSTNADEPNTVIRENVPAILQWYGSPALDGLGLILVVDAGTEEYAIEGSKEDFRELFGDENKASVITDFEITGEKVRRGWNAVLPEARIIEIKLN